jgi:hypothetical protein
LGYYVHALLEGYVLPVQWLYKRSDDNKTVIAAYHVGQSPKTKVISLTIPSDFIVSISRAGPKIHV